MQRSHQLQLLLPILVLAACRGDEPTAPRSGDSPEFSHTASHKVVNSTADPGDGICNARECTLREAIKDPASSEISFASGLTGPITLARSGLGGGTLAIEKSLAITGPTGGIIIRRRSTDPAFRIMRVGSGVTVRLTNLNIRNGRTDRRGGGIINFGRLTLTRCTVGGNAALAGGGGIDNHASLTLTQSVVSNNAGGGIVTDVGSLTVTGGSVADNSGTGIVHVNGRFTLSNTTVARNLGAGISNRGTTELTLARIIGNSGSGISAGGERSRVTVTRSTIAGNSGSGIRNRSGSLIVITNSTISGNTGTEGGGIFNLDRPRLGATVTLTNSTVSGNSAVHGGGIYLEGSESFANIRLTNSTVANNSATEAGGGIFQSFQTSLTLINSMVATNRAPAGPDVHNTVGPDNSATQARFSLIGDGTDSGVTNSDGNQVGNVSPHTSPIDPKIGPLANNGGPTRTHALLDGSPAIDAASDLDCPATDQRGVSRPQGAGCDIGSYERE